MALATGFSDQAHYCWVFRDVMGISPNVWRHKHLILALTELDIAWDTQEYSLCRARSLAELSAGGSQIKAPVLLSLHAGRPSFASTLLSGIMAQTHQAMESSS